MVNGDQRENRIARRSNGNITDNKDCTSFDKERASPYFYFDINIVLKSYIKYNI